MPNPNLVVFNGRLLAKSETFIRAQAEGLKTFTPYYVGAKFVGGLELPIDRTLVVNNGGVIGSIRELGFKFLGIAPQLYQKVQQLAPALVHAHFGVCGALALPLVRQLQVPSIVTFHGLDATMSDRYARTQSISTRLYLQRREKLKHETNLFITVSEFLKSELIRQNFPEEKIKVHYIGVDTQIFQPNPDIQREPIVLFVGRLVEKKGCEYLMQAMYRVQATMPEVQLVIIGDGELRSNLEHLAKSNLVNYRFLGVQPSDVVKSWMHRARVFCVPSIRASSGDSEGFGIVFAEAQAVGLPVVSFDHGGISEAVSHGETGLLAKEGDSEKLAQYILKLLNDRDLWQKFSNKGIERVRAHFNLHKQNQALEDIYRSVLAGIIHKGK
ncbi:glycosyltransferase [Calothrix sp. PCC 6303]|uniref:glycosyltransferase n=1 Tax=Calothrix sp. PCC 6303 TaxID=1170562 RepID=UPI0002A02234|nr:glycosyltransferase [Calothrix sp. PCC 6303]AFZ01171.1 glycosyl transferase group 1 [Calothrix sp. PCC 6303]